MENAVNKSTSDYLNQTLSQTKTAITKLFDYADNIDRKLYGRRMKFFLWGSILVLIVAPILDELFKVHGDRITYFSTLLFFVFLVALALAFIGSWRDDDGNWSLARAKSRILTYYETLSDTVSRTRTNSSDENIFRLGQFFFFGGIAWKALQNVSVFVRKPVEGLLNSKISSLRHFERFTNHYYWIPLMLGIGIIIYLYNKNPKILERVKIELRQLFGWSIGEQTKYSKEVVIIKGSSKTELVLNAKTEQHINFLIANSKSNLLSDFATALQKWNPRGAHHEYEYQDRLYRHLRKYLPEATLELEYPIGDGITTKKGRADIVVNDTILIEMKRDSSAGAVQRARGQISQYSEIWKGKGPVILLLCDFDYELAKLSFASTMTDLNKLERPVMTIVATPKEFVQLDT